MSDRALPSLPQHLLLLWKMRLQIAANRGQANGLLGTLAGLVALLGSATNRGYLAVAGDGTTYAYGDFADPGSLAGMQPTRTRYRPGPASSRGSLVPLQVNHRGRSSTWVAGSTAGSACAASPVQWIKGRVYCSAFRRSCSR